MPKKDLNHVNLLAEPSIENLERRLTKMLDMINRDAKTTVESIQYQVVPGTDNPSGKYTALLYYKETTDA